MILLGELHNMSLSILLPWKHTGFQTSPILKAVRSILIFASGASSASSSKDLNMVGVVFASGASSASSSKDINMVGAVCRLA